MSGKAGIEARLAAMLGGGAGAAAAGNPKDIVSPEDMAMLSNANFSEEDYNALMKRLLASAPEDSAAMLQNFLMGDVADLPEDLREIRESASKLAQESVKSQMMQITPIPWMVVKTALTEKKDSWPQGMKVFLNMCHHEDVLPPPTDDPEEIERALKEADNVNYRVPLSLAGPRMDRDKAGKLCLVFECCINDAPMRMAKDDQRYLMFIIELCFEWIEEKHKVLINREFSLPKMVSKGPISAHSIRRAVKPKITEVPKQKTSRPTKSTSKPPSAGATAGKVGVAASAAEGAKSVAAADDANSLKGGNGKPVPERSFITEVSTKLPAPEFKIVCDPPEGQAEFIVVTVSLLKLASFGSNMLEAEPSKLIISSDPATQKPSPSSSTTTTSNSTTTSRGGDAKKTERYPYTSPFEIPLPFPVDVDSAGAQFDRSTRVLTVTLSVKPPQSVEDGKGQPK